MTSHDEILGRAIEERGGYVFKTVGDAFCATFLTARDALEAALFAQQEFLAEEWGEEFSTLRARMALQLEWLERLEAEHDNMRAALSWALERKEAEVAFRLEGALGWFWFVRGYYSEGRRWLEEALAMDGRGSPEVRAMVLARVGDVAHDQGDLDRAKEVCEEGLELLLHEGREESEAKLCLLTGLGWVAWERKHGRRRGARVER